MQRDLNAMPPMIQKSTVRALNRTIQHVQSQSVKSIAQAVAVPQKLIRQKMKTSKAKPWQLSAKLSMNLFPLPVMKLKPKQTKRGVTAAKQVSLTITIMLKLKKQALIEAERFCAQIANKMEVPLSGTLSHQWQETTFEQPLEQEQPLVIAKLQYLILIEGN